METWKYCPQKDQTDICTHQKDNISRNKSRGFRLEFSNGMLFFGPFPTECLNAHVYCTRKRPAKTPLITFRREFHTIMAIATPVVLPHLRCNGRKIRVCFFLKMSKHAQGWVLWFNWRKKSLPHLLIDLGWVIQFKERGWLLSETLPELALCTSFWLYSVFVIRGILSRQKRDAYLMYAMNIKGRMRITFFR